MEMLSFYSLLLFLALFFFSKYLLLQRRKNLPPSGPLCLPIIGHLYLFKKPLHRTLAHISAQYGSILLLQFGSRRVLVVSSPSAAEECFTTNDIVFSNRPRFLAGKHLFYNYTTLSWAPYGHHWRNLRRITTLEIFSSTRLQRSSKIRTDEVRSLVRRLFVAGDSYSKPVEMKSMFFELTLNILMMMIAGKRYYGDNMGDVEKAKRFREIINEMTAVNGASNIEDFLPLLRWVGFKGLENKLMRLQRTRDQFMQELMEEHRKERIQCNKKTMIDVLLSLQEAEPDYYTDEIIIGILQVLVSAGTETSTGTMEWAMSLLLNHPEVLRKAQVEIDTNVGRGRLLEESDLTNLPYLHCIINETMRMYPAAPLLVPRESSEECTVGGFIVPRGTMLLVNMWAIQNDPKIWVEPTKFRPEKMEGVGVGVREAGFKLMPFGSGRRSCPGDGLAIRVIGLTLGSLIQCFEWERVCTEAKVEMSEGTGMTTPKAKPLEARCKPRPAISTLLSQL